MNRDIRYNIEGMINSINFLYLLQYFLFIKYETQKFRLYLFKFIIVLLQRRIFDYIPTTIIKLNF